MRAVKTIAIGLLAWPVAEMVAFIFVAALVGVPGALFLVILTSFAGLLVLRQFGGSVTRLRAAAGHARIAAVTLDGAGMAPGLGGILLLIPGFITSVLGILMLLPMPRRWLLAGCRRMFATDQRRTDPGIIDLAPAEWRPLPGPTLPPASDKSKD